MEKDPQKVSAVLSDPTRYHIYQHVLTSPRAVGVSDVAEQFGLHPNVARMHLGKLVDIGLLTSEAEKKLKGGRPGYAYKPSGSAVSLTVPARDFQLLADLLVQSLVLTGDGGKDAIEQIGRTFGRRLGREAAQVSPEPEAGKDPEVVREELVQACAHALERLGIATYVTRQADGAINLVLKTCGFQEVATAHPEQICHLCKAMLEGITQSCSETNPQVTQAGSVPKGDKECTYQMNNLIRLE
ncbi:MAG TPA: helix-turn-helix domain-containing protein [Symbiobacteriaceae bacterium]